MHVQQRPTGHQSRKPHRHPHGSVSPLPLECRRRVLPGHVAGCLSVRYASLNSAPCKHDDANPKRGREG
eukprot:4019478-Karenia_brevis.AAC.1